MSDATPPTKKLKTAHSTDDSGVLPPFMRPAAAPPSKPPPLSIGIKTELHIAFTEAMLLNTTPLTGVTKKPTEHQAEKLRYKSHPDVPFRNWALHDTTPNPGTMVPNIKTDTATLRAYMGEPCLILATALTDLVRTELVVADDIPGHTGPTVLGDDVWSSRLQPALGGLITSQKIKLFPKDMPNAAAAENWDVAGLALRSPLFTANSLSEIGKLKRDVEDIMEEFGKAKEVRVVAARGGSMHVHVGRQDGRPHTLAAMRQLAYILAVYEDQIARLHPVERRPEFSPHLRSNRREFTTVGSRPREIMEWDDEAKKVVKKRVSAVYRPMSYVRLCLFKHVDHGMTPEEKWKRLREFVGKARYYVVNFSFIHRDPETEGPKTLEFRQHKASLDPDEIYWWTVFCTKLTQLAYTTNEKAFPLVKEWEDSIDLCDLWDAMEFPTEGQEFYLRRLAADPEMYPEPVGEWEEYNANWSDVEEDEIPPWANFFGVNQSSEG
ncbi:hypothetical protein EJ06DRAFT_577757 [Trichodelitschia bisporula]|uniref:Amidoligase enzyme n=1 Tax=Trichodelitschia bisporula TaxID=703511 RepID=A0A6G1HWF5_9PEZI|nr:hypothetical protein EJ06DRAFT_577757 [Trichodelitschia bisporula]